MMSCNFLRSCYYLYTNCNHCNFILLSNLLGCTKSSVAMATAMSYKSPFALPPPSMRKSADMAKVKLSNGSESGKR